MPIPDGLSLTKKIFGKISQEVVLFTLALRDELQVSVMNYGATLTHLKVKDRFGNLEDVVLGFDSFEEYLQQEYLDHYCYLGSTVGRAAGRISYNRFTLDGKTFDLPPNQGHVHLHGGREGWDKKIWDYSTVEDAGKIGVTFYYQSKDGEENYPGNVDAWVTYSLDTSGVLEIHYMAQTDKKTIINPTNHSYFNLSGKFEQEIGDHELKINADRYLPINSNSLPTGEIVPVHQTPFDFRTSKILSSSLAQNSQQLDLAGGIDHAFVLEKDKISAELYHHTSGRLLQVYTTEPALQVYTGNYLNKHFKGKNGIYYDKRAAVCLETQHFADSMNNPHFPTIILDPENQFDSKTQFKFSTR